MLSLCKVLYTMLYFLYYQKMEAKIKDYMIGQAEGLLRELQKENISITYINEKLNKISKDINNL